MSVLPGLDPDALFDASPNPYVLLDPALTIVWTNEAYLRVTMRERSDLIGRGMFDAFPSDPESESGRQLRDSLHRAFRDGERDHVPLIRYDIARPDGQGYEERYWSATHTPLLDREGTVRFVLQHTVDITELHRLRGAVARPGVATQVEGAVFQHARQVEDRSRALVRERDQLRSLFEQAPGFMAVLQGPDHVFALANEAYSALIGDREIVGMTVAQALPEVGRQGFLDILDGVYSSGQTYVGRSVPVRLRVDGETEEERILDFVYQPIRNRDGEVTGIFVQGHDLTDQKRAERALQESEERFRLVAESAPVMLWMGDGQGKCLYLNRAQREFWGVADAAVSSFDWGATLHPGDRAALSAPFRRAMTEHEGFNLEARYRRADGEYRVLHSSAQPRFDAAGEFAGMIGVNVDITEVRRAEAALREETHSLEILNQTSVAVAAELDLDRVVQKVTDAGVELTSAGFGAFFYNVLDEAGESYMLYSLSGVSRDAFDGYPMPRATKVFEPTFKGEGPVRSDDILKDPRYARNAPYRGMPQGHLPVRSYLAVPVKSRSGEVLGGLFFGHPEPGVFGARAERLVVGLAAQAAVAIDNARLFQAAEREIAQRKQAEAALQDLNATLEEQVAERTEELRQKEEALRHAQKMEAVGRLTGGVAHDFNNLLQVIGGNLQMLARDVAGNDRGEQRLQNALAGVSRGARLASQLLAFGRRQPLAPRVVNLGRLVMRLDDMLRRAIGEGIELETVVAGGLWNGFVDPAQVENALLNLAINARDAMEGHGRLTIEAGNTFLQGIYAAQNDVEPGQYVMLAVTDTGCGMPREVIDQAFDPFFTTKAEGKGTGLGLSQVYGFVKQSGGHVKIYSEVGHGTTIRMYLPRVREEEAEDLYAETAPREVAGGTETILVVEDDENVRATTVEMLTDLGYRLLKAKDAQSALAIVESGAPIDLVFTDVVMPGPLRSTEMARRAQERLPDLGILFTSGYAENAIVHGGRLDAGVELLSKPYTREALALKLREVLGKRAAGAATPPPPFAPPAAPEDVASEVRQAGGRTLRILLVEDDVLIRMSTADMLAALGHSVVEAGRGEEALAILSDGEVDLLMTDIGLPDVSGSDLATEARRRRPDLPVVFASGHEVRPEELGSEFATGVSVLRKPYDERSLANSLERALAG